MRFPFQNDELHCCGYLQDKPRIDNIVNIFMTRANAVSVIKNIVVRKRERERGK